ncbi:hypothetical protein HK105_202849 [Polyrhizophydium stewartii]|uniref:Cux N-terminal domain-containing protein n=1 Tax=Polyrhizophydium stewartii TaxID=2732419 RepID=A0ABR4NDK7_9FUNG|nr:hypothetical protein HK105_003786 [Polyrhizophydium stewartii]
MAEEGLTTAMRAWEKLGFAQLQRELDAQGLAVIENQNQAAAARKRLAEETREFKKVPDEEKLKEFKNLLKEIDSMTKRSKFAETSFLTLYKQLSDMPDPAPLIASALDQTKQLAQVATLQAENRRLRDELATQQAQLAASKSAESSIGSLKQRLSKYEAMAS